KNGVIAGNTFGSGKGGDVSVSTAGGLSIDGSGANSAFLTGITAQTNGSGDAGTVTISAGSLAISANGVITTYTSGSGKGGDISVSVASGSSIDGTGANLNFLTGITAQTQGIGDAGNVTFSAGSLAMSNNGAIAASTFESGKGGNVSVSIVDG